MSKSWVRTFFPYILRIQLVPLFFLAQIIFKKRRRGGRWIMWILVGLAPQRWFPAVLRIRIQIARLDPDSNLQAGSGFSKWNCQIGLYNPLFKQIFSIIIKNYSIYQQILRLKKCLLFGLKTRISPKTFNIAFEKMFFLPGSGFRAGLKKIPGSRSVKMYPDPQHWFPGIYGIFRPCSAAW